MDKLNVSIFIVLVVTGIAVVYTLSDRVYAQTTSAPTVNFTQLFEQKFTGQFAPLQISVVYESPYTVVLQGEVTSLGPGGQGLIANKVFWQGVDLVKQSGFTIDSLTISGGGSTAEYLIVLSHK